ISPSSCADGEASLALSWQLSSLKKVNGTVDARCHACDDRSVLRHLGVNAVGPGEDAARQVAGFSEASLAEEVHSFGAAHAGAAMHNHVAAGVELVYALGQITQRNHVAADVADLVFVRLAHIKHEHIIARIPPPVQLFDADLRYGLRRRHFFAANAAE